jgi:toxin-antitoxin system PIN domain toxin
VIAVDTNVLVYADRLDVPLHKAAFSALRRLSESSDAWGIPVFCIAEFLRVVTHPRMVDRPTSPSDAWATILTLFESPSARLLSPGPAFLELLGDQLKTSGARGNLVFDAQIAAVCLEHGVSTLLTEDRDFSRFRGIRVQPLTTF